MAPDARVVLNRRRKQQQVNTMQRWVPSSGTQLSDARQLLKLKKFRGMQKAKLAKQNFVPKSNWNANRQFNRPFVQNFPQGTWKNTAKRVFNSNRNNFNKRFQAPTKTVQVAKSGILKITSRAQNQPKPVPKPSENIRFVSNLSGLTVTTRNRPTRNQLVSEVDNGDELERMTLQDIPEITKMRDVPQSLLVHKKAAPVQWELPGSSKSTLFSRLAKSMENTMVADTVSTVTPFSPQCWKVVVTNLQPSVTDDDIAELFGHVGVMKSAEIAQPGMAIIEYYSKEDAVKAHGMYHNRLLDGYPMQCVLHPEPGRSTVASRLGERYQPGLSTSHSSATSSSLNPSSRRVAFTVQLP